MKELTIEEKVKAYDKAIEIAKEINNEQRAQPFNVMTKVFHELAESEDDRIRKEIILALKFANVKGVYNKHISWLEKQGEHAKFRDSIQVGDKVTRNKDGVLVNLSQLNRVAKKDEKQGEQKPAFEMKTPEESLGVDSDTYNKIVDECVYGEQNLADKIEPKIAAWTHMDEQRVENLLAIIEEHGYPGEVVWLNSLKDRVQSKQGGQKPNTDFSDLRTWKYIVDAVLTEKEGIGQYLDSPFTEEIAKKLQKRFGNIEHKPTWKPSDEQMEALESATENCAYSEYQDCLRELIEQLKKL